MFQFIMNVGNQIKQALASKGIGLKIVGKVDLDALEMPEQPKGNIMRDLDDLYNKLVSEIDEQKAIIDEIDKRMKTGEEEMCKLASKRKQLELRLEYLKRKGAVRAKYNDLSLSNDVRQKELTFQGIRPERMDVVHFHTPKIGTAEEMDGVALVKDENHYYLAVDMYPHPEQEDNATTIMEENPDGTFEGIWPKYVVLKKAQKFEEKYMRNLVDKYADDIERADLYIASVDQTERDEMAEIERAMNGLCEKLSVFDKDNTDINDARLKLKELEKQLQKVHKERNKYSVSKAMEKTQSQLPVIMNEQEEETVEEEVEDFEVEYEPVEGLDLDTETEKQYPHLPYLRGKRDMVTMNWPKIEKTYEPWLRYRLMSNIARLMSKIKLSRALTYVMTEDYYEELSKRGRSYYKGMTIHDVVSDGEVSAGVLVFPNQGHEDTVMYNIDCRHQMSIIIVYIREGRTLFYESYSEQEILGKPRTDSFMCKSLREAGTETNRLFGYIRNLIISFLAMERDMERTVNHLIEEGKGSATELQIVEGDEVDTTDDKDVVLRDANWYTDITVNREIPVRGYISHRWCGTGKDKYIKEVWVRPHVKQGYHRSAGVKK